MAITVRYFVFEEDGSLKHVPRRVREGLYFGEDTVPAYAGTTKRAVEVVVDNEDGKPVRICDARGIYWKFDEEGRRVEQDARLDFLFRAAPQRERSKGKVVDLRPDLERQKWERKHFWNVTAEDLDRITAAVWPWAVDGDGSEGGVQTVKGTARKVPPLTRDGEEAFRKIRKSIHDIDFALERLSEPALKGLAYELRRVGRLYQGDRCYYEAAAVEADKVREIQVRHRTGQGAWYATVKIWLNDEERGSGEVIDTIEERHESRPAALEATRRLLAENAHRFDRHVTVEAEVISELEWAPISEGRVDDDLDFD